MSCEKELLNPRIKNCNFQAFDTWKLRKKSQFVTQSFHRATSSTQTSAIFTSVSFLITVELSIIKALENKTFMCTYTQSLPICAPRVKLIKFTLYLPPPLIPSLSKWFLNMHTTWFSLHFPFTLIHPHFLLWKHVKHQSIIFSYMFIQMLNKLQALFTIRYG